MKRTAGNRIGPGAAAGRRGFSLLELLVALAVFAIMAAMAYGGLRSLARAREQSVREADRLAALQSALVLLQRDLVQAVARPIQDEYGKRRAALEWRPDTGAVLEFTRTGRRNPAGKKRGSLLRVGYRLTGDGRLQRDVWPGLDRSPGDQPFSEDILDRVEGFRIRIFQGGAWHTGAWPPADFPQGIAELPRAVEIILQLKEWGTINRLFLLPG